MLEKLTTAYRPTAQGNAQEVSIHFFWWGVPIRIVLKNRVSFWYTQIVDAII